MRKKPKIAVIGAGASGCFAALQIYDELQGLCDIQIFEKSKEPLSKLKISGGGRCNVTHNLFDPELLSMRYPRGNKELRWAFESFSPSDTITWFQKRGVTLKAEADGRMFPTTDSSETIINCFLDELKSKKIPIHFEQGLVGIYPNQIPDVNLNQKNGFRVLWEGGFEENFGTVVIATGSNRKVWSILEKLGHKIITPVPSLFTLTLENTDLVELTGLVVPNSEIKILPKGKPQSGPMLITHWGLSGPCALRLSAWEARTLFEADYKVDLSVNWIGGEKTQNVEEIYLSKKEKTPGDKLVPDPLWKLPNRFWEWILNESKIQPNKRYSDISKSEIRNLCLILTQTKLRMVAKGVFKEEFVTAGGVSRKDIQFQTMESKKTPGLFFTGEVIDVDGVTGGFNFQNAWTTATIAARGIRKTIVI
ncbi:NAD(P)/FAD-dependent oxidoreductase [Leptospira sp. 2 VSF19]|uniref:NAD(P)/FAD-dependent oxidoreductase n=1 Tax=Leptospira soteropolitanensis TaxID=2950025 RepID=A0AAW5VNN0_9LEPT|nr:NAD(P)/FAD-dependent oxidoreductase [Leptospira soteropolitanensis]MCW7494260.1 NAD(P)/FAD-dependent oxidoreductase [Leptospira soteropolitanensis]MCW7501765.1 NAD(P)/FAD-dependent oxidoreductase [Leptospira soteropolitanensis]MCW7524106.1 NAD(P)/FAD-dependent oxidoreductase [Leptospira soteropolitanensis]MCW7527971.1 NAD(P)/FAD-dependent oxidoreductase [Leptospira soteropolitanensis]MCW7531735.1 NAD(P)/FAD-dependent oxidoreductase [Leptospira soteropolitanensis]